jgi:hypothetical protein
VRRTKLNLHTFSSEQEGVAKYFITEYEKIRQGTNNPLHFRYEDLSLIFLELSEFYIHIHNKLEDTSYELTSDVRVILAKTLLYYREELGWDLTNYREAVHKIIDDTEFEVFIVKM